MSFNSLPNETLQRIVDCCHEADGNYKERMEARPAEGGGTEKQDLKDWRGRSCSAMSRVNKTLRSLSAKYIFTVSFPSDFPSDFSQYPTYKMEFADSSIVENTSIDLPVPPRQVPVRKTHHTTRIRQPIASAADFERFHPLWPFRRFPPQHFRDSRPRRLDVEGYLRLHWALTRTKTQRDRCFL